MHTSLPTYLHTYIHSLVSPVFRCRERLTNRFLVYSLVIFWLSAAKDIRGAPRTFFLSSRTNILTIPIWQSCIDQFGGKSRFEKNEMTTEGGGWTKDLNRVCFSLNFFTSCQMLIFLDGKFCQNVE